MLTKTINPLEKGDSNKCNMFDVPYIKMGCFNASYLKKWT